MLLLFRPRAGDAAPVVTVTGMYDEPTPLQVSDYDKPTPGGSMYDEPTPS